MAKNQVFPGPPTCRREAACPSTVVGGDAVLLGGLPAVCVVSYQSVSGTAVFDLGGSYRLSVTAKSSLSPSVNAEIKQGQNVYYDGGTLDSTTNVTTGGTLDANSSTGVLFGKLDPQYQTTVATGTTDTQAWVRLQGSE